ncbi:hypothetical protein AB0M57_23820 [Streptomyces sp. NPDC051597]|uniref:hypothetical protein n=1 Tax=Streptomyces sp. NPDC051597 TaxID=3155049 RepID=UPI0034213509
MSFYDDGAAAMNMTRASWALAALEAFGDQTGQREYFTGTLTVAPEIIHEVAGDLVANIFHLARMNGLDPESIIAAAEMHFEEEMREEVEEAIEDAAEEVIAEAATGIAFADGISQLEDFLKVQAK